MYLVRHFVEEKRQDILATWTSQGVAAPKVGGGTNFCTFVVKYKVAYAASKQAISNPTHMKGD